MTFARLTRGDWVAAVAALALLLVMSVDWYSTEIGEQARRDADQADTSGAQAGEPGRQVKEDAQIIRSRHEKNAWQADPFADRLILFVMLAAVILAVGAGWLRAADKRFTPPWTPSALATAVSMAALILLAARIVQKPSVEAGAVVKFGAPLGLACLGAMVIASRASWNAERDGSAWTEPVAGTPDDDEDTAEREALQRPQPVFDHADADGEGAAATAVAAPPEQATPADDEEEVPFGPVASPDAQAAERERRRLERQQGRKGGRRGRRRRR